ncbi:unnamed protein product [Nippostrongylus brasiliensis]|uniref:Ovule protein n=1 Tax=Nippostrongylus brasiliensis TaxID=27835 RepID=A0A0N4XP32_NIPBR|nr:unnamed protein product [Nippostrongylus brasiliensis]
MGGEKEREEFWALGIAEMKKGREILEARAKIEELQKQLFDATTALQTVSDIMDFSVFFKYSTNLWKNDLITRDASGCHRFHQIPLL